MPKTWQKIIIAVILVSLLLFYPLHIVQAVSGWLLVLKEYVLDLIARIITRILLTFLNNSVVGRILVSGRLGGPAFIQDWRNFLQGAQYRGEDVLRSMVADITQGAVPTACPYIRDRLQAAFGAQNKLIPGFNPNNYRVESLEPYKLLARCTLSPGLNITAYQNNFSQGGWAAWNQLIQPQNNFFGTYTLSLDELVKQRKFEESLDTSEAGAGAGYTGKRQGEQACTGTGNSRRCLILGKIVTPGRLFSDSTAATIDREFDWLISADELEEALLNTITVVTNRLVNYAAGAAIGAVSGPQYQLGADGNAVPNNPVGQSQQDCVDACIATNCPDALSQCVYETDPITGAQTATNMPCTPEVQDTRPACISNCQAQGCR